MYVRANANNQTGKHTRRAQAHSILESVKFFPSTHTNWCLEEWWKIFPYALPHAYAAACIGNFVFFFFTEDRLSAVPSISFAYSLSLLWATRRSFLECTPIQRHISSAALFYANIFYGKRVDFTDFRSQNLFLKNEQRRENIHMDWLCCC